MTSPPDANDWVDLKAAFDDLVDRPAEERATRLRRLAAERPAFAARLATLLAADDTVDRRLARVESALGGAGDSAEDEADPLGLVGRTIGAFVVEDVLGRGGMGVAYRARDTRLDRPVALKFVLPERALDAGARLLLLNEARAASALDHPNVCTVFEAGEAESGLYFVMPAYAGETLRERIDRAGALPLQDAVGLARQILRGLAAAHSAGITHRDLKPSNLVVTPDGTLKILDFGLATIRSEASHEAGSTPGTLAYMSPEQLLGDAVDARTDLWSTGVVLHEMLTGRQPFGGGIATPWSILNESPPPTGASPRLDAFLARLLARRPEDRFAGADSALAALETAARPPATARRIAMVGVAVALAGLAGWQMVRGNAAVAGDGDGAAPSVAILPFLDTSPDASQAWLADGVAEELINALARVPGLRVPGRVSSFAQRQRDLPAREIARRLGVATFVEGSVQRAGDRVQVTARLVDADADRVLWTQMFERPADDLLAVEAEIATTIAQALTEQLAPPPVQPAVDVDVYELYLRGRFHWNRRTPQDLALAIDFFHQAIARDSAWAAPWAGLALAYAVLPPLAGTPVAQLDSAVAAATRALVLDSTLADAHAARGYARHWQWRWADAGQELERAIALNPASSTAHEWYGEHLAKLGRTDEGIAQLQQAIALDPLSLVAQNDLGIALMLGRRHDEAIAQLRRVQETDPTFAVPFLLEHRIDLVVGRTREAAEAGRRFAEMSGLADGSEMALLPLAVADTTLRSQARRILEAWTQAPQPRWVEVAFYSTLLGDHERAIRALQRAFDAHAPQLAQIGVSAWVDPLRADPRVIAILQAMNFPATTRR